MFKITKKKRQYIAQILAEFFIYFHLIFLEPTPKSCGHFSTNETTNFYGNKNYAS